jgi:2-isopropylmalate synthase
VECTINGIGERAGNASLEEIVMAMRVKKSLLKADCRVDSTQIYAASRLGSQVTGLRVQPNKAIVGDNAFAHEAGIHQHGLLFDSKTYEIMNPEDIGIPEGKLASSRRLVLGKHSGKHAFRERLKELGWQDMDESQNGEAPLALSFEKLFARFKSLADKKKQISDRDIEALMMEAAASVPETWILDHWVVNTGSALGASGTILLRHRDGKARKEVAMGSGPIDAIFKAINRIIGKEPVLDLFEIDAVSGGSSSQGETMVKIAWNGRRWNGRGVSIDVVESSIKAYIAAINAMEWELKNQ